MSTLETNVRFRWEYRPGSDIFVVYTDGRDTMDPLDAALERGWYAPLLTRSLVVKLTRLFRF
ncbi:MAG TPA: hypothetical protein VLK65_27850 [Vicinamibacteria bacterium]|nr:hypothetical protein [Vicinamibacteria bacterium]